MNPWKIFNVALCSAVFGLSIPAFSAQAEGATNTKTTTPLRLEVNTPYSEMETDFPPWPQERIIAGESVHRYKTFYAGDITVEIYESEPLTLRIDNFTIDEFVTVLSGKLILTVVGEEPQHFVPGDSVLIPKGFAGTWEMQGNYRELLVVMGDSDSVTNDKDIE
ncbi:cupin domain-containing protein [SAR92 clade bacterium H246]